MTTDPSHIEKAPRSLDQALRPESWKEYVGQEAIKENLQILLQAAQGRNHQPEHVLLYGPPGLGKTTLAHLIAKEVGASLRTTSGPASERVGDLAMSSSSTRSTVSIARSKRFSIPPWKRACSTS